MLIAVAASTWGQAKGAWLGQTPPGETPVAFASEIFATLSPWVESVDFSPDGKLCLVSVGNANYSESRLFYSRSVDGIWSPFKEPPFTAGFKYSTEAVFMADGKTMQFTGMKSAGNKDFWTVTYSGKGWGEPVALPAQVNSESNEFRGSYMKDGTFFFGSERSGMMQVYRSRKDGTGALTVSLVGPPVSMGSLEGDPCVAPDGSFLVFYSCNDNKSANLFVSFRDGTGGWGQAFRLVEGFNTSNDEYGAHLSVDGKYFFFTRHGKTDNTILWVSVSAIERLKR